MTRNITPRNSRRKVSQLMLNIERFTSPSGSPLNGFLVRDGSGKVLAVGAGLINPSTGFVLMKAKRYARNVELCQAIANLTNLPVKWNIDPFKGKSEYEIRRYWHQVASDRQRQAS